MGSFYAFLVLFFLASPGLVAASSGFVDLLEEYEFKSKGIATVGRVIGRSKVKQQDGVMRYDGSGGVYIAEAEGDYILNVEYVAKDGKTYHQRTKKAFDNRVDEKVPVIYAKDEPNNAMINGFYKVGDVKYSRLILGGLWAVIIFSVVFFT